MATKKTETVKQDNTIIKSKTGFISIPGIRTNILRCLIIGTAPLIVHRFSEKLRNQMLAKHMGEASVGGRENKDPVANFMAARHRLSDGSDGFPAGGIKAAIVDGCDKKAGIPKTAAKSAFRVLADDPITNLVRIIGPAPEDANFEHDFEWDGPTWPRIREDMTRTATGTPDVRHRPEYPVWAMELQVEVLENSASDMQVMQAIAMAGRGGLGEWRPKSKQSYSGSYGVFRFANEAEIEAHENGSLFAKVDAKAKPKLVAAE